MNPKQLEAFDLIKDGKNVFLTGSAGTGKSYLLKEIYKWASSKQINIGLTATTGLAAYLIRGRTIYSYLGIGLGTKSPLVLAAQNKKRSPLVIKKICNLEILIIDEVSMMNSKLLKLISDYLCEVRGNCRPFGGVQVILCGDFCQLPPVEGEFCFLSDLWSKMNTIVLTELVRQQEDVLFQKMLSELRWGNCSPETLKELKKLKKRVFDGNILPTKLYSKNKNVDQININEYNKLIEAGAVPITYTTKYSTHANTKSWCDSVKIPEAVELCTGAQVMISWNIQNDDGECNLVNGARGVVVKVVDNGVLVRLVSGKEVFIENIKITCEDNDKIHANFMPLKLAYALTIHKSQGMTLDALEIDLGDSIFEYGQAYVALSRAKNLESIKLIKIKAASFKTHPLIKDFYGIV